MRGIFEILSIFDWITPSIGYFEDLINDPTPLQSNSWTFFIPYGRSISSGWNAFNIENLMKRYGIKTWGSQITGGDFFFSVNLEQASWAEYILLRYGVPIREDYLGAPKKNLQESSRGLLSFFSQFLD